MDEALETRGDALAARFSPACCPLFTQVLRSRILGTSRYDDSRKFKLLLRTGYAIGARAGNRPGGREEKS